MEVTLDEGLKKGWQKAITESLEVAANLKATVHSPARLRFAAGMLSPWYINGHFSAYCAAC